MSFPLPCPWCGSLNVWVDVEEVCCPVQYSAIATCRDCGVKGPDGSGLHGSVSEARRDVVAAWNNQLGNRQARLRKEITEQRDSLVNTAEKYLKLAAFKEAGECATRAGTLSDLIRFLPTGEEQ